VIAAIPLAGKVGAALVITAVLIGGYALWSSHIEQRGYDRAISAIAAQDREAVNAADNARDHIRACRASGGVWRSSTGQCERG
jgi:hypothetical protein